MRKSKGEHAAPHSSRTLDGVVVSRRGSATAPSSALPAHALSGARLHTPTDFLIRSTLLLVHLRPEPTSASAADEAGRRTGSPRDGQVQGEHAAHPPGPTRSTL